MGSGHSGDAEGPATHQLLDGGHLLHLLHHVVLLDGLTRTGP